MRGHYVEPMTDELKKQFLELIAEGQTRPEAAAAVGSTARRFRALCNPESPNYDEVFASRYRRLTEKGGEHDSAMLERLRAATLERGLRSSDRLLEKLNTIHDPDWAIHRPQAMQLNFMKVDELKVVFGDLSDDTLHQVVAELQRKKELAAGDDHPVIDQ